MYCTAYTSRGHVCNMNLAGEYCKAHNNSLKMIGESRFFQNQKMYPLLAKSKQLQNTFINSDGTDAVAWSDKLIVDATIQGQSNLFSVMRKIGPHTQADQISYENHLRKVRSRKAIRTQAKERKMYMFNLIGDGRIEPDRIAENRRRLIAEVENGLTTAREAYDTLMMIIREPQQRRHRRQREIYERWMEEDDEREEMRRELAFENAANAEDWNIPLHEPRTLAQIAADPQSVHTSEVLNKVKEMVELIRKIEIPEEYRWNMENVSKTMTEIISECELTPAAASQFSSKYCAADTIYDMEEGIFGKLTDAMWQHVKKSEDRIELKKIVKSELQDNIGMCAQGNLSRIANILVGYLDGLSVNTESRSEQIGKAMAELTSKFTGSESNVEIRLAAMAVLVPFHMTAAEMKPWIDAVTDTVE